MLIFGIMIKTNFKKSQIHCIYIVTTTINVSTTSKLLILLLLQDLQKSRPTKGWLGQGNAGMVPDGGNLQKFKRRGLLGRLCHR